MSRRLALPLRWAKEIGRPASIPLGRPRGAKLEGIRYERKLATALASPVCGQWFDYTDASGRYGFCQTDAIVRVGETLVVLEAKYTWTEDGHRELEGLYLPVVEEAGWAKPIGLVISRNLVPSRGQLGVRSTLSEAIEAAEGGRVVWHWLGVGPLLLRPPKGHEVRPCMAVPAI